MADSSRTDADGLPKKIIITEDEAKFMVTSQKISQRIENFEKRFGPAHLYLAYHAAFPLALTPDLTYRIWANFQKDNKGDFLRNKRGRVLNIPWIAVADLLLSDFCNEVAHELYEMEQPIRNELLKRLRADGRFGKERIEELSQFLLQYIEQQLHSDDPYVRNFAEGQKWIVNAYMKPNELARELAEALSEKVKQNDKAGVIRLAAMVETVAEPLIDSGLEHLLIYSEGMEQFAKGNVKRAKTQIDNLLRQKQSWMDVYELGLNEVTGLPSTQIRLNADRQIILIDPCLSKQNYTEKIMLTNTGNMDAEISKIEADEDCSKWVQIVYAHKTFTLLSSDSAKSPGLTAFEEYAFKVIVRPGKLSEGWNQGKIYVCTAQQEHVLEISVRAKVILPKDCEDYIGIDFGTTNSVIAIYDSKKDGTHVVQIYKSPDQKTALIPSVLVFEGGYDNFKIGWEAQNEAVVSPELTVRSIRRVLGYGNNQEFYGKIFSPDELAGCIIKKLIELAEVEYYNMTHTYYNIRHAIVTVPANFYDLQIRGILKACKLAGLDTEEELVRETSRALKERFGKNIQAGIILDEPSAAALFYLDILIYEKVHLDLEEKLAHQGNVNFLVFDYGGETLDVSIVEVLKLSKDDESVGIRVLANKGNNLLGGDSIDLTLMRVFLRECKTAIPDFDDELISCNFNELQDRRKRENWSEGVWKTVLLSRYYWKKASEDIKVRLSADSEASFDTEKLLLPVFHIRDGEIHDIRDENYSTEVSRYKFEGWIERILSGCETLVRDALDFADIDAASVDYIIHTGRSSLIPSVRERVKSIFPDVPDEADILEEEHLRLCVAKGAAMYGAQKISISGGGVHLITEGRKLPHSYGIAKQKGTRRMFEEIIPHGSSYPIEKIRHYGKEQIMGRRLHLIFFQNSGKDQKIRDNSGIKHIGEITIILPHENLTCDVKFVIDANRKLEVYANDEPVDIKPERLQEEERWIG